MVRVHCDSTDALAVVNSDQCLSFIRALFQMEVWATVQTMILRCCMCSCYDSSSKINSWPTQSLPQIQKHTHAPGGQEIDGNVVEEFTLWWIRQLRLCCMESSYGEVDLAVMTLESGRRDRCSCSSRHHPQGIAANCVCMYILHALT